MKLEPLFPASNPYWPYSNSISSPPAKQKHLHHIPSPKKSHNLSLILIKLKHGLCDAKSLPKTETPPCWLDGLDVWFMLIHHPPLASKRRLTVHTNNTSYVERTKPYFDYACSSQVDLNQQEPFKMTLWKLKDAFSLGWGEWCGHKDDCGAKLPKPNL